MNNMGSFEDRLKALEARNARVEIDKKWETSVTRRLLLFGFTYVAIGLYMWAIRIPKPGLNAVVPAVGFMLSTLTLPLLKKIWLKYR